MFLGFYRHYAASLRIPKTLTTISGPLSASKSVDKAMLNLEGRQDQRIESIHTSRFQRSSFYCVTRIPWIDRTSGGL